MEYTCAILRIQISSYMSIYILYIYQIQIKCVRAYMDKIINIGRHISIYIYIWEAKESKRDRKLEGGGRVYVLLLYGMEKLVLGSSVFAATFFLLRSDPQLNNGKRCTGRSGREKSIRIFIYLYIAAGGVNMFSIIFFFCSGVCVLFFLTR